MDSEMQVDDLEKTVINTVDAAPSRRNTKNIRSEIRGSSLSIGITPEEAVLYYRHVLSPYEQKECRNFAEIYYVGGGAKKVYSNPHNHGFDSAARTYKGRTHDHVFYRYELLKSLGKGYSSHVFVAFDHRTRTEVALKCFRNTKSCQNLAKQEEDILQHLSNGEEQSEGEGNIVRLLSSFTFRRHRFLVLERLHVNLYDFVKQLPNHMLEATKVRAIAQSLLKALLLLHKEQIVHCDLKPENIVFRHEGRTGIKLVDFGTGCRAGKILHQYIGSRYYRAPEVVLGLPYGCPIDMWSYGCVLAELLYGSPIFYADGEETLLALMIATVGLPPNSMVEACRTAGDEDDIGKVFQMHFFEDGSPRCLATTVNKANVTPTGSNVKHSAIKAPRSRDIRRLLANCKNPMALDFLEQCLVWDPSLRMTPQLAMQHPWMKMVSLPTPRK